VVFGEAKNYSLIRVGLYLLWLQIAQKCFAGVERLNVIQSAVFDTAYRSAENLLICAPTGAGRVSECFLSIVSFL
jgi:replicative superfamily II helicase